MLHVAVLPCQLPMFLHERYNHRTATLNLRVICQWIKVICKGRNSIRQNHLRVNIILLPTVHQLVSLWRCSMISRIKTIPDQESHKLLTYYTKEVVVSVVQSELKGVLFWISTIYLDFFSFWWVLTNFNIVVVHFGLKVCLFCLTVTDDRCDHDMKRTRIVIQEKSPSVIQVWTNYQLITQWICLPQLSTQNTKEHHTLFQNRTMAMENYVVHSKYQNHFGSWTFTWTLAVLGFKSLVGMCCGQYF